MALNCSAADVERNYLYFPYLIISYCQILNSAQVRLQEFGYWITCSRLVALFCAQEKCREKGTHEYQTFSSGRSWNVWTINLSGRNTQQLWAKHWKSVSVCPPVLTGGSDPKPERSTMTASLILKSFLISLLPRPGNICVSRVARLN